MKGFTIWKVVGSHGTDSYLGILKWNPFWVEKSNKHQMYSWGIYLLLKGRGMKGSSSAKFEDCWQDWGSKTDSPQGITIILMTDLFQWQKSWPIKSSRAKRTRDPWILKIHLQNGFGNKSTRSMVHFLAMLHLTQNCKQAWNSVQWSMHTSHIFYAWFFEPSLVKQNLLHGQFFCPASKHAGSVWPDSPYRFT